MPELASKKEAAVYAAYRMPPRRLLSGPAQAGPGLAAGLESASVIDLGAGTGGSAWAVGHELRASGRDLAHSPPKRLPGRTISPGRTGRSFPCGLALVGPAGDGQGGILATTWH